MIAVDWGRNVGRIGEDRVLDADDRIGEIVLARSCEGGGRKQRGREDQYRP